VGADDVAGFRDPHLPDVLDDPSVRQVDRSGFGFFVERPENEICIRQSKFALGDVAARAGRGFE
jgi:hypothetical protein